MGEAKRTSSLIWRGLYFTAMALALAWAAVWFLWVLMLRQQSSLGASLVGVGMALAPPLALFALNRWWRRFRSRRSGSPEAG